jgi:hypothetical protein
MRAEWHCFSHKREAQFTLFSLFSSSEIYSQPAEERERERREERIKSRVWWLCTCRAKRALRERRRRNVWKRNHAWITTRPRVDAAPLPWPLETPESSRWRRMFLHCYSLNYSTDGGASSAPKRTLTCDVFYPEWTSLDLIQQLMNQLCFLPWLGSWVIIKCSGGLELWLSTVQVCRLKWHTDWSNHCQ